MVNWICTRTDVLVPGMRHWYLYGFVQSMLFLQNLLQRLFSLLSRQNEIPGRHFAVDLGFQNRVCWEQKQTVDKVFLPCQELKYTKGLGI